jgi:hypothetical protein
VFVAKCLNKIKDYTKAEDVCDDIIDLLNEKEEVTNAHKFALKAHYMKAKNMLNLMEFRRAKQALEEGAKPILKKLIDKFHVFQDEQEVRDLTKDLVENRYSFEYRKKYALYLKKFAFYDQSIEILNTILRAEIEYYNLQ